MKRAKRNKLETKDSKAINKIWYTHKPLNFVTVQSNSTSLQDTHFWLFDPQYFDFIHASFTSVCAAKHSNNRENKITQGEWLNKAQTTESKLNRCGVSAFTSREVRGTTASSAAADGRAPADAAPRVRLLRLRAVPGNVGAWEDGDHWNHQEPDCDHVEHRISTGLSFGNDLHGCKQSSTSCGCLLLISGLC